MESGDRCISRGVLGMMMPTGYNNGTLILQPPGYVVFHSEMIHNARIVPVDGAPRLDDGIRQWEGAPRGRWEGNTLVIESTNFRAVRNMRGPTAGTRSRQSEAQRVVERLTVAGPDLLFYSVTMDDPETYTGPWTAAFPYDRDDDYVQFEQAGVSRSHPCRPIRALCLNVNSERRLRGAGAVVGSMPGTFMAVPSSAGFSRIDVSSVLSVSWFRSKKAARS